VTDLSVIIFSWDGLCLPMYRSVRVATAAGSEVLKKAPLERETSRLAQ